MTKNNYLKLRRVGSFTGKLASVMVLALLWCVGARAQVNIYGFNQSSSTYTEITGGTVLGGTASDDEFFVTPATPAGGTAATGIGFPIGFNFTYNGVVYDVVGVNNNGWISLGQSALGATAVNMTSTSAYTAVQSTSAITPAQLRARIAGLNSDLQGQTGSEIRIQTIGTSPNQTLVVQWKNYRRWNQTGMALNFQIRLSETSNNVEVVYGAMTWNATANTAQAGLSYTNTDFNIRTTTSNWNTTTAGATVAANMAYSTTVTVPVSGTVFQWTPPPPCSGTPTFGAPASTTINICSGTSPGTLTYSAYPAATGVSYQWESSPDGVAWTPISGATLQTYAAPNYTGVDQYYHLVSTCSFSATSYTGPTILVTGPIAPTIQTSNIAVTSATFTSMTLTWTNGNGLNGRVVYVNTVNSFVDPVNGVVPTAAAAYAGGQQCVFVGTGNTVTVTGLTLGTIYYVRAYEYTCAAAASLYQTATATNNPATVNTADYLKYDIVRNTNVSFDPVSGSALNAGISGDDAMSAALNIGFPFSYAGVTRTQFKVSTNGFMTFNTTLTSSSFTNGFAGVGAATMNTTLAPFWDDLLVPAGGAVKYEVTGTAPNRILTVEWNNLEMFQYPGPSLNFQVKLYETSNVIEYVYGVMQGFDGTNPNALVNGRSFTYSMGMSNASWLTAMPAGAAAGELIVLQAGNSTNFSSKGTNTSNEGNNKIAVLPDCYSGYTFTPQPTVRPNDGTPALPGAPVNDNPAGAITLTTLPTIPANFCGSYYSSAFATPTTGVPAAIGTTLADDDVWFKFTAISNATTIAVRGSGGYDPAVQILDATATTVLASKNATGNALTETINSADLTTVPGTEYLVRVYHANTAGVQATATANLTAGGITSYTVTAGGSGYILSNGVSPRVFIQDATGTGAVASLTITGGAVTAVNVVGTQNGTGYTAPTVVIMHPASGVTGDFSIIVNATPTPPANDEIGTATVLTPTTTCVQTSGNSYTATASPQAVCGGTADDDVWYAFTSIGNEVVTVSPAVNYNAHVQIFSSSDNTATGTLTSLGCINAGGVGTVETSAGINFTPGNTYFVRVYHSAVGAGASGQFNICVVASAPACPVKTSPTNGGTAGTDPVTLTWNASTGATSYDVYFGTTSGALTLVSDNQVGTSYSATLGGAGTFYWNVEAVNGVGNSTGCTEFSFSTAVPNCPTLTAPANAASIYYLAGSTLTWTAPVGGATGYNVYLDTNNPPTTLVSANQAGLSYVTGALAQNVTYYWRVDPIGTFGTNTGCVVNNFITNLPPPPVNDDPCGAITLTPTTSCTYVTYTTEQSTNTAGVPAPTCGNYAGNDVWFKLTVPAGGAVTIDSQTGTITDSGMEAYTATGSCPGVLTMTSVQCDDDDSQNGFMSYLELTGLTPGSTLYLRFWRWSGGTGTFGICATIPPAPPVNDDPCGAIALTVNPLCSFVSATNVSATNTAGAPAPSCGTYVGQDVWFTAVVPAGGGIKFDSNVGTMTDGAMTVYTATGTCPGALTFTEIACDDNSSNNGLMPSVTVTGQTPGTTLYVRFWRWNGGTGTFSICAQVPPSPPTNDDICTAMPLAVTNGCSPTFVSNELANTSVGAPAPTCGTPGLDVWFSFVAPASGSVIINTQQVSGGLGDGVMQLYSATGSCPTPVLTNVACDDDSGPGLLPQIGSTGTPQAVTPGATYYIRVWGFGGAFGTFGICLTNGAAPAPVNDEPAAALLVPVSGNSYPSCGTISGDLSTATNSTASTAFTGPDVWYRFVAQASGVRVVLNGGGINGAITLLDNALNPVATENANAATGGVEILNQGGLIPGATYYVGVGQDFGSAGGPFTVCIQQLRASTCADGPGSYDLCANFKASYTGANSYSFAFTQTSPAAGPTTTGSSPNQIPLSTGSLNLRHGYGYSVVINAVYNLANGVGTPETVTVPGLAPCAITIAPHANLRTKDSQRCPATVLKGTTLQAKPFICAAINHTITFQEVTDCTGAITVGPAFTSTTAGSSANRSLASVGGVQAGKWYAVTWTPNFSYGPGTPGTTDIIQVAGVASEETAVVNEESFVNAALYPNPNNGEMVNLNIDNVSSDNVFVRIFDNMGRVVYTNRFAVDGSLNTIVTFNKPLANGLYMVEFTVDGQVTTERMIVEK